MSFLSVVFTSDMKWNLAHCFDRCCFRLRLLCFYFFYYLSKLFCQSAHRMPPNLWARIKIDLIWLMFLLKKRLKQGCGLGLDTFSRTRTHCRNRSISRVRQPWSIFISTFVVGLFFRPPNQHNVCSDMRLLSFLCFGKCCLWDNLSDHYIVGVHCWSISACLCPCVRDIFVYCYILCSCDEIFFSKKEKNTISAFHFTAKFVFRLR